MKNERPEKNTTSKAPLRLSPEAAQAVERFIRETDWDAFWDRVVERAAPEIEAYERARAKSLSGAYQHVFLQPEVSTCTSPKTSYPKKKAFLKAWADLRNVMSEAEAELATQYELVPLK